MVSKGELLKEIARSTKMSNIEISERMNRAKTTIAMGIKHGATYKVMEDMSELIGQNLKWLANGDGKWN